jgi:preprotein translocase subunit SecA
LKLGIGLRGYAQVDPKNEYKREGYQLFEKLLSAVEDDVTSLILRIQVQAPGTQPAPQPRYISPGGPPSSGPDGTPPAPRPPGAPQGDGQPGSSRPPTPPRSAPPPARRVMPAPSVPASHAFDLARRQQAMAAAAAQKTAQSDGAGEKAAAAKGAANAQRTEYKNVGRNDSCPCGSGKKFKNCHGA